jgi:hypothetical protein
MIKMKLPEIFSRRDWTCLPSVNKTDPAYETFRRRCFKLLSKLFLLPAEAWPRVKRISGGLNLPYWDISSTLSSQY